MIERGIAMPCCNFQTWLRCLSIPLAGGWQLLEAKPPKDLGVISDIQIWDKFAEDPMARVVNQVYKDSLLHFVEDSDKIELIEHSGTESYESVDPDPVTGKLRRTPYREYRVTELPLADRARLVEALRAMPTNKTAPFFMCFNPHHTLRFSKNGRVSSKMFICFSCDRIRWDIHRGMHPEALIPLLKNFVRSMGMDPGRRS